MKKDTNRIYKNLTWIYNLIMRMMKMKMIIEIDNLLSELNL